MLASNPQIEIRFMKSILTGAKHLFAHTDRTWFHSTEALEIWDRIANLQKHGKNIPQLATMQLDPVLSEAARMSLQGALEPFPKEEYQYAIDELDFYRKGRTFFIMLAEATQELSKDRPDLDATEKILRSNLMKLSTLNIKDSVLKLSGDNLEQVLEEYEKEMDTPVSDTYIPTGFKFVDGEQGGLARGSLTVIGANSGGGKSTFAKNLSVNVARAGYRVGYIALEMDKSMNLMRTHTEISGIELKKLTLKNLTKEERKKSDKALISFLKELGKVNGCLDYYSIGGLNFTLTKALSFIEPENYDMVVLDYVNLFESLDPKKAGWDNLGESARLTKVFAEKNKCAILYLSQIDQDMQIKYARAIEHHADSVWLWKLDDKARAMNMVEIKQFKNRRAGLATIPLSLDLEHSRFYETYMNPMEANAVADAQQHKTPSMNFG